MDVYRSIYIICISLLISCSATDTTLLSGIEKDNFDNNYQGSNSDDNHIAVDDLLASFSSGTCLK